ncbi:MAG: hypothetical protein AB4911_04150 [Oscillochloridaceae bacterium umkhey_bin13]
MRAIGLLLALVALIMTVIVWPSHPALHAQTPPPPPPPLPRITTLAGPSFGLDGPSTAATFVAPNDVAFGRDAAGDFLLVADRESHAIRRLDLDRGLVTTLAGQNGSPGGDDGLGGAARFFFPERVAVSPVGAFALVFDQIGVRRLDLNTGLVTTLVREPGSDLVISPDGSFALLANQNGILRLDLATNTLTTLNPLTAYITSRMKLALRSDGQVIFATTYDNHVILQLELSSGTLSVLAGSYNQSGSLDGFGPDSRFDFPIALALKHDDSQLVVIDDRNRVREINLLTLIVSTPILVGDELSAATGIVFSPDDSFLAVAGWQGGILQTILNDEVAWLAGREPTGFVDAIGTAARFGNNLGGVSVSPDRRWALAADPGNGIRRLQLVNDGPNQAGTVTTLFADPAVLDLAISSDASFVVYTTNRGVVRQLDLTTDPPTVNDLAGLEDNFAWVDGIGTGTRFSAGLTLALSPDDRFVLVADHGNAAVRRVDLTTIEVTTLAGNPVTPGFADGPGTTARFNFGSFGDLVISHDGSFVLITEGTNQLLRRIDLTTNEVSSVAGQALADGVFDGIGSAARLNYPQGVALSLDDQVAFVLERHGLRQVDLATNTVVRLAGSNPTLYTDGIPIGFQSGFVALTPDQGYLLLSDPTRRAIRLVDLAPTPPTPPPAPGESHVDTLAGQPGQIGSRDGVGAEARFSAPTGIAVSATGIALIADTDNHTIRRMVVATASVTTLAGAPGDPGSSNGPGDSAQFNTPTGVTIDRLATVAFVADQANHTVRQIDLRNGEVTTYVGQAGVSGNANGLRQQARLRTPIAVALVCSSGPLNEITDPLADCPILLIADTGNHVVRHVDRRTGQVTTLVGQAGTPGNLDGVGEAARFNQPGGLAMAPSGRFVLVADLGNNAVRRIELPGGVVRTLQTGIVSGASLAQGQAGIFNIMPGCDDDLAFVLSAQGHTVSEVSPLTGDLRLLAGQPNQPGFVDGGGPEARFKAPSGGGPVCEPGKPGSLLIGDTENALVRAITLPPRFRVFLPKVDWTNPITEPPF